MNFLKNTIQLLSRMSGQNIIFPFYHTISNDYLPHISPLYTVKNIQSFQKDLCFLLKHFEPVGINDVYHHIQRDKIISKPAFHLSFDDGLREVHDIVLPVLEKKGIPATVFVNSAFVDNADLFYRYKAALTVDKLNHISISRQLNIELENLLAEINLSEKSSLQSRILKINYLQKDQLDKIASLLELDFPAFLRDKKPYLSSAELKTLQIKGFSIGGHSIDHPLYRLLDEEEQIMQTIQSCRYVKSQFSEERAYFSFPFSNEGVKDSFFSKIYNTIDFTFGISGINTSQNGKHIERIGMESYAKNAKACVLKAYIFCALKNNLPVSIAQRIKSMNFFS